MANLTVYKYPFRVEPSHDLRPHCVELPRRAQILSVGKQGDLHCFWALVCPTAPLVRRRIHTVGTGWDLPVEYSQGRFDFLTRVTEGRFEWHVFIEKDPVDG